MTTDALSVPADTLSRHPGWVRTSHWILAAAILTLAVSGFAILMVHPRLYWGDVGNDLTPAWLELPISRNYRHGGWEGRAPLTADAAGPITANRTYDIFNQNGWARSLHFLAAWCLVIPGVVYLLTGLADGHFRTRFWPRAAELSPASLWRDAVDHVRLRVPRASGGSPYGLLQKLSYVAVVFVLGPLMVLTGLAMSPAVTASLPWLVEVFGGYQSARTIHFFAFASLAGFAVVHVAMVVRTGFARQVRAMTTGG
jgi:thiosulfate reductase cytochrome b subunit